MSGPLPIAVMITPVLPAPNGPGPALRAWDWLLSLARSYTVHVVLAAPACASPTAVPAGYPAERVWDLSGETTRPAMCFRLLGLALPALVLRTRKVLADGVRVHPDGRILGQLIEYLHAQPPSHALVFRLRLHAVAEAVLSRWPATPAEIDLDDVESGTRFSIAAAQARMGRPVRALYQALTGLQYRLLERHARARYRTAWLASPDDCADFATRLAARVACRPNRIAGAPLPMRAGSVALRMLFVGTLNYAPNEEAARFLLHRVVPLLRGAPFEWRLTIAGRGAPESLRCCIRTCAAVDLLDAPEDLAGVYAATDVALVPVYSGGGTKLKTLEAFAYGRPVIATAEGVRGLPVVAGREYLAAQTAAEFAAAIVLLAADRGLARNVALAGNALWRNGFRVP